MHTLAQQQGLLDLVLGDPYRLLFQHLHYLLNGYGWRPRARSRRRAALDRLNERLCRDVFDVPVPIPSNPTADPFPQRFPKAPPCPLLRERKPRFALRMTLMLIATLLVFGGVFAVKAIIGKQMNEFFDNMPQPAAAVSAATATVERWSDDGEAVGTGVAVNGTEVTTEAGGVVRDRVRARQPVKAGAVPCA